MISLDYTVGYQIILYLILLVILSKVLFRPYLTLLEERERKTVGAHRETTELEHEGERLKAEYEEKIAQAQAAGNAAKETILKEAQQLRENLLARAREEASSALERVRQEVQNQMQKEKQLATAEVAHIARDMVSKILGRNVA